MKVTKDDNINSWLSQFGIGAGFSLGHASRALWCAGVPNIYLFHPHLLYTQLLIRQLGIYSTPFIYHINHLNQ
jgi:hypothetical protein